MTRVRVIFTGVAGTPWYSNWYFDGTGDDQPYADIVGQFWNTIKDIMFSGVSWAVQNTVTHLDVASGQPTGVGTVTGLSGTGTDPSDPLPYATQMLLTLNTGQYVNGRQVRGRINVPGITEPNTSGGLFSTAATGEVLAAANTVRTAVLEPDNFWLVYSKSTGTVHPVTGNPAARKPAILRSRRD